MFDEVRPDKLRARGSAKWETGSLLAAGVAEMDFDPPSVVREAIIQRVQLGDVGLAHPLAVDTATSAFTDWVERTWCWTVEPQSVVVVADVMRVLDFCLQHLVTPGSAVVVPTPAFPPLLQVPSDWKHPVVRSRMVHRDGRWQLDLDDLARCFDEGAELLLLCHPHNPLGTSMTVDEMEALAHLVESHGGIVMSDEIHAPLTYATTADGRPQRHVPYAASCPTAATHTVTAASAGKGWNLGGMKCAVMVLSDGARESWLATTGVLSHGTSTLGMWATTAAFNQGGEWLDKLMTHLDSNRHLLARLVDEHLPGVRYEVPDATYLGWLDFRDSCVPSMPAAFFREHGGVILDEGANYGEPGLGHVRLNFGTSSSMLTQIVETMGTAMWTQGPARVETETSHGRESAPD